MAGLVPVMTLRMLSHCIPKPDARDKRGHDTGSAFPAQIDDPLGLAERTFDRAGPYRADGSRDADQSLDPASQITIAGSISALAHARPRLDNYRNVVETLNAAQLDDKMRRQTAV